MKRSLAVAALLGAVGLANAQVVENPILKKLVEKGILSEQEAAVIDEQLAKEEMEKAKYQAEIDKVAMETKEKLGKLEKSWKDAPILKGKFKKFEVGGKAYLGYTYQSPKGGKDSGDFEARRFYFDTKAYLSDKDYIRFTTDLSSSDHKIKYEDKRVCVDNNNNSTCDPNEWVNISTAKNDGGNEYKLKIKYGYLYKDISSLIPHTGFEFGIAHTPWIDFEEHTGWWYRSVDKTFIESSDGMYLWPSADLGINFKTKTPYITSEIGFYNGEGYDHIKTSTNNSSGFHNSIEGRLTYHVFGNGDKKMNPTKDQYANISLHLASNIDYKDENPTHKNLNLYHIHAVYNHPMFLIAGQYGKVDYNSSKAQAGDGYSVNFEIRPVKDWALFGRYDHWEAEKSNTKKQDVYYFGIAYTMNKYVKWIANYYNKDDKLAANKDLSKYMLTAELSW